MKAISSAIIALAGAIVFSAGALVNHGDTQLFVCAVGILIGLIGMIGWVIYLASEGR